MKVREALRGRTGDIILPRTWLPVEVLFTDWKDGYESLRLWVVTRENILLPMVWPSFLMVVRARITTAVDNQNAPSPLHPSILEFPRSQLEFTGVQLKKNMIWLPFAFRLPDLPLLIWRNAQVSREMYPRWKRGSWPNAAVIYLTKIQPSTTTLERALQNQIANLEWGPAFKRAWAARPILPRSADSDIASPPSTEEILSDIGKRLQYLPHIKMI